MHYFTSNEWIHKVFWQWWKVYILSVTLSYPCYLCDTTPHSGHQVQHPCYLQDIMPCQWSPADLLWVLQIWESVFLLSGVFHLALLSTFSRLSQDWKFNLKVSRTSCWSSKHSQSPTICLNHNNPHNIYMW